MRVHPSVPSSPPRSLPALVRTRAAGWARGQPCPRPSYSWGRRGACISFELVPCFTLFPLKAADAALSVSLQQLLVEIWLGMALTFLKLACFPCTESLCPKLWEVTPCRHCIKGFGFGWV